MDLFADLADACGADPGEICELVHGLTDSDRTAEIADWMAGPPLRILLIIVGWWVLSRLARRWVDRLTRRFIAESEAEDEIVAEVGLLSPIEARARERLRELQSRSERSRQRATTMGSVLRSTLTLTIGAVAFLLVLGEIDVDLAPLIAGAGIAGIAIGFGAQSLVKDFLSGIFIVFEDQYGVGDDVDLGEATGQVERVTLRTTRVRDLEGTLWVVPNGEIQRVANRSQLWARTVLDIDVAYDADMQEAMAVIDAAAVRLWEDQAPATTVLERPEVLGVQRLGENAVTIRVAVKTEPAEQWSTARALRQRIKTALDEAGIEIPFPQRVVTVLSDEGRGQPG